MTLEWFAYATMKYHMLNAHSVLSLLNIILLQYTKLSSLDLDVCHPSQTHSFNTEHLSVPWISTQMSKVDTGHTL